MPHAKTPTVDAHFSCVVLNDRISILAHDASNVCIHTVRTLARGKFMVGGSAPSPSPNAGQDRHKQILVSDPVYAMACTFSSRRR